MGLNKRAKDNSPQASRLQLGSVFHWKGKDRGCAEEEDTEFHFIPVKFRQQLNEYLVVENFRETVSKAKSQRTKKLEVEADSEAALSGFGTNEGTDG